MAKTLELQFLNEEGKTVRLSIDEPKSTLTSEEVSQAMDVIISSDVKIGRASCRERV